jgi:hypothetical protein
MFELSAHLMHFIVNVLMVCGKIANISEVGESFFPLPGFCQPARTFFAEKHSEEKDTSGYELHCKGDNPLFRRYGEVLADTVRDPKAKNRSDLDFSVSFA